MAAIAHDVKVYIYDLSRGLARTMSQAFLGKQLEGIWHTGIVVYGQEFYFGGQGGIECCPPAGTMLGQPTTIHSLGQTQIPYEMFVDYLRDLSQSTFRGECYHLLDHNCNTFSSEIAQFLTGNDIPAVITSLPAEVMSTPFGQMIRPFIDSMSVQPTGGHALFADQPSFNQPKTSAPPRSSTASQSKSSTPPTASTNSQSQGSGMSRSKKKEEINEAEDMKPFIYAEEIPKPSYWSTDELGLTSSEQRSLKEVYEFLAQADDTWSLGGSHMTTLHRLVLDIDIGCESCALLLLCRLVLKEDILHLMSHDPRSKFSEILDRFENSTKEIKISVIKMLTNCSSLAVGHSLLHGKHRQITNNICVSCLLSENMDLRKPAIALTYNLSHRKLLEDSEIEIGSALLNCVGKDLDETTAFHLLAAILHIMKSNEEVKGLAGVLGINFDSFKAKSDRVAKLCDSILTML